MQHLELTQLPNSALATEAWGGVSKKYTFLSTLDVVKGLGEQGIVPYQARTMGTRIEGKRDYAKHLIRFRQLGQSAMVGDVFPEIVLTNSHDRASSFHIELGLFRLICANGLVVSNGNFAGYRIRHVGSTVSDVIIATKILLAQFPYVGEHVAKMQAKQLTDDQRMHMAQLAMGLRWDADKAPFEAARLLNVRRDADMRHDLWSTFNVIQENLLRGQHVSHHDRFNQHARSSRAVKSIDVDMELNRNLWELASTFSS